VVGFLNEARKSRKEFKARYILPISLTHTHSLPHSRMKREEELAEKVAARKKEKENKS
jgi:hypothetical protein